MKKHTYKNIFYVVGLFILPLISNAQLVKTKGLLQALGGIVVNILIPLAFTAGLLFFFWGVAKYIKSAGSEKEEGKKIMTYGVVALFVMASVWGLVAFLRSELGIGDDANMKIPSIGGGSGGDWQGDDHYGP